MATIQTAIKLHDGMTPVFKSMSKALGNVINLFEATQGASTQAFDQNTIRAARAEIVKVEAALSAADSQANQIRNSQEQINDSIRRGTQEASGFGSKIKTVLKILGAFVSTRALFNFGKDSLGMFDTQYRAETQLASVLKTAGGDENAFNSIKDAASRLQGSSMYGDEAFLGGAAEFSTYMSDANAIESMMGTLSNYAAGMSGGTAVSYEQMVDYATQLGKAFDGTYDGLLKKGFVLTDAQKEIIENGTDMERALVIDEVIAQSWENLAENMANTPMGKIVQFKNALGDIREEVGGRLYGAVLQFVDVFSRNLPQIKSMAMGLASGLAAVVSVLSVIVGGAVKVAGAFGDNWFWIAPIIMGVVGALIAYNSTAGIAWVTTMKSAAAMAWKTICDWVATAAIVAMELAQYGLNAALALCPINWIVMGIIMIIAVFYAAIAAVNHFAGTSLSATGIVVGAFAVAGALIWNTIIGVINAIIQCLWSMFVVPFISVIEFVLNVCNGGFNSFGDAVANLIGQIIGWFLSLGTVVTKIIDAIFGTNWTAGLEGLKGEVIAWGRNESAITLEHSIPTVGQRIEYGTAWDKGNEIGQGFEDKVKGLFKMDSVAFDWDNVSGGIYNNTADMAENTAAMANFMELSQEDLKYMRDIAEREAVNRFTTAEIRVEMNNNNSISSGMDIDGMINDLAVGVNEAMERAAEGVHA